jgi:lysophospholipase L1-like esterase
MFDRYERSLRGILVDTREILPHTLLILCEPFILNTGAPAEAWPQWKSRIDRQQETVRRLAREFGATLVPLQAAFDEAAKRVHPSWWLYDGVHPSPAGHRLIAKEWIERCGLFANP